ncbi:MAG: phytanoyl-CoA dioxygenase family protein [Opitutales bacterium]
MSLAETAPTETTYKKAPPGFTEETWDQFMREGFLVIENVLTEAACDAYVEAIDRIAAADPNYDPGKFFNRQKAVCLDPALVDMIDRESHIGYAYDLYGELTKVHLSNIMIRPTNTWRNLWHPDGARALPFQVFSPELPLQLKVGYWLTDLPDSGYGNLVVLPGSHKFQYLDAYDTHDSVKGEVVLKVKRGAITLMHCSTWHRVDANESSVERKNIFMTYCPGWITPEDRFTDDAAWLATLTREQRILMRSYGHPYANTKPPEVDSPLYLDRNTGQKSDPGVYAEHVTNNRRKRLTFHEKLAIKRGAEPPRAFDPERDALY